MNPLQVADPYAAQRQMARKAGYSDSEIDSYITQKFGSQRTQTQSAPKQTKKVGGIRGALLNLIPTVTSAIGTVAGGAAGTILAPGAGTAAGAVGGGAVGGGIGEFLRSKLAGEETKVSNVARETAFGALGGVGKGVQAVKAAKGAKAAVKAAEQTTEGAMLARKGIAQKFGEKLSAEGAGLKVGKNVGDINDLSRQAQIAAKYAGTPKAQLKKMSADMTSLSGQVDDILTKTPVKLDGSMVGTRLKQASTDLTDERFVDLDLTNPTVQKIIDRYSAKFAKAQDAKSVNDIVKTLNKTATRATDKLANPTATSLTAQETAALALKRAGDDVLSEIPEIAPLKKQMAQLFDINPQVAQAAEQGIGMPFVSGIKVKTPIQAIKGAQSKAGAILQGTEQATSGGYRPYARQVAKATIPQAGVRAGSSVLFGTPFVGSGQPETQELPQELPTVSPTGIPRSTQETSTMQEATPASIFSDRAKVEQVYMQALQNGDIETANAIMKGYELFGQTAAAEKPLSAEASKVIANANSGLTSIADLEQMLQQDPEALKKTIVPGRSMFGGAVGNALGTAEYDTVARNIADVITRLRTGAALTPAEEQFYKSQLPQAFDSPEVINKKIQQFKELFSSVANRTGTAGTDMQAAVGV